MLSDKVRNWEYIPKNAFLYFPQGQQIKLGQKQKSWRKIFQSGDEYDSYQKQNLQNLESLLVQKKIQLDSTVDEANKLRFLQANKFDVKKTVTSLDQYSKWRMRTTFPIKMTQQHRKLIQSGAFYFCGRDHYYRPIMVIDIGRFDSSKKQLIPETLVDVMQFMLSQLLIEGQVQNYILIMDLQQYSLGLQSVVSEILAFTSNSYRGRLFCNYILSMPTVLSWGWQSFAKSFVSENTLRKIKISKSKTQKSMWDHIDKSVIQKKFGGTQEDIKDFHWPPKKEMMTYQPYTPPNLISVSEYNQMFKAGKLSNRKVHKQLIQVQEKQIQSIKLDEIQFIEKIQSHSAQSQRKQSSHRQIINLGAIPDVKKQRVPNFKVRAMKTFFDTPQYAKISKKD